jgi:hyperosmotically inducible protein
MRIFNTLKIVVALLVVAVFMQACQSMTGRSAGRVVDDKAISAQIKAKLAAEKVSNLTRIGVTTVNGVVHLDGVVDRPDDKIRAEEIARKVSGVTQVVDNIQVSATPAASPGSTR